jgi:hypothetical protein
MAVPKTEIHEVYEMMTQVASTSAAAPQVAPAMPAVIIKIASQIVKQVKIAQEILKATRAIPEMLKKINGIKPPNYKKYREEDPRRNEGVQNTPTVKPKPKVLQPQKPMINVPNTTQVRPKSG